MTTLQGQWVTSFVGWMRFYPRFDPEPGDSERSFERDYAGIPPLIGAYRAKPNWGWPLSSFILPSYLRKLSNAVRFSDTYERREGYWAAAGLITLNFDGIGNVHGIEQFNLAGANSQHNDIVSGTYTSDLHPSIGTRQGEIQTLHVNNSNDTVVNHYAFVVRSDDELEWVAMMSYLAKDKPVDGPVPKSKWYKARVAHGTFRRVVSTIA